MLYNYEFYLPARIIMEENGIKKVPSLVKEYGMEHPMLLTDSFLVNLDFTKDLIESIPNVKVFTDIEVNPSIPSVAKVAQFIKENEIDGIVTLGGGSCMDTAKAASVEASEGVGIFSFLDGNPNKLPITKSLPIIALPTTSGTGSEVSQYAVITNPETLRKDSITTSLIVPKVAILDPMLTLNLPRKLTIATGLDVLSHALESVLSKLDNSFTDVLALEAIKKVFTWLPVCVKEPQNLEARKEMAFASNLAGIAMSHCCGTLPHGMGCPLSGHFQVPHGLAVGVIQKYALMYLDDYRSEDVYRVVKYVDPTYAGEAKEARLQLIQMIENLFDEIECPQDLAEFHLTDEGIEKMVEDAWVHGCTGLNPSPVDKDLIRTIYKALKG